MGLNKENEVQYMRWFENKDNTKRSIDEILTPRDTMCEEADENVEGEVVEEATESQPMSENVEAVKDAILGCFGWDERKTEKWLVKSAHIWYAIMSFVWFLFGAFTFAPIIFISQKIGVVFHNKKLAILIATALYLAVILVIVLAYFN